MNLLKLPDLLLQLEIQGDFQKAVTKGTTIEFGWLSHPLPTNFPMHSDEQSFFPTFSRQINDSKHAIHVAVHKLAGMEHLVQSPAASLHCRALPMMTKSNPLHFQNMYHSMHIHSPFVPDQKSPLMNNDFVDIHKWNRRLSYTAVDVVIQWANNYHPSNCFVTVILLQNLSIHYIVSSSSSSSSY